MFNKCIVVTIDGDILKSFKCNSETEIPRKDDFITINEKHYTALAINFNSDLQFMLAIVGSAF